MQIGTMELIVLLVVAFLVLGPERMVTYARKLGRFFRILKIYLGSMTEDFRETVVEPLEELKEPLKDMTKPFEDLTRETESTMSEIKSTLNADPTSAKKTTKTGSTTPTEETLVEDDELEMAELVEEISNSTDVKADLDDAGGENEKTDLNETEN